MYWRLVMWTCVRMTSIESWMDTASRAHCRYVVGTMMRALAQTRRSLVAGESRRESSATCGKVKGYSCSRVWLIEAVSSIVEHHFYRENFEWIIQVERGTDFGHIVCD